MDMSKTEQEFLSKHTRFTRVQGERPGHKTTGTVREMTSSPDEVWQFFKKQLEAVEKSNRSKVIESMSKNDIFWAIEHLLSRTALRKYDAGYAEAEREAIEIYN